MLESLKKKTQNLAGSVAINSQISENERTIQNLFTQLGKDYFNLSEKYPIPEVAPVITRIKELQSKIFELSEEMKKLKGIKKCLQCNREMPYEAGFCPACGYNNFTQTDTPQAAQALAPKQCPNCGTSLSAEATFCTGCGNKI